MHDKKSNDKIYVIENNTFNKSAASLLLTTWERLELSMKKNAKYDGQT